MDFIDKYPEYAAIEKHIRDARLERVVVIAHAIAGFIVHGWTALNAPPAPAAILIDRRRETRDNVVRAQTRFAHR